MATSSRTVFIGQGVPSAAQDTLEIYPSGQSGTLGAKRILTHPDGVNFPPIVYYSNPTRTFNLDNEVLIPPAAESIETLTSQQVVRFQRVLQQVVASEVWEASEGRDAAMPTSQFRQLYEYLRNPPAYDPLAQTYVTWQPRDKSDLTYNVQLFALSVGGGNDRLSAFDVDDRRLPASPEIKNPLETMDVSPDGLLTRQVTLRLAIVSVVP